MELCSGLKHFLEQVYKRPSLLGPAFLGALLKRSTGVGLRGYWELGYTHPKFHAFLPPVLLVVSKGAVRVQEKQKQGSQSWERPASLALQGEASSPPQKLLGAP